MTMRRAMCSVMAGLCLFATACAARAQTHGYDIAIAPFLPVRTLVANYQPMVSYLEKRLGESVTLLTSTDYRAFNAATQRHEYPFIITVANAAFLAHADAGYMPLLKPVVYTRPTLVVSRSVKWDHIRDLRGQVIAVPDALSVVAMQAPEMLREAGLNPEHDVKLAYAQNHAAAASRVLAGEAGAAVISDRAFLQMNPATRQGLRKIATWEPGAAPGVVYLSSPHVPADRAQRVKVAILEFVETPQGQQLMEHFGYGGLQPATPEDLRFLAPYGAQLREALKGTSK